MKSPDSDIPAVVIRGGGPLNWIINDIHIEFIVLRIEINSTSY